jgi:hypothetical protein
MTENEKMILSDRSVVPTDDYIFSLIGEKKVLWKRIMDHVSQNYSDISGSWNFYNDGKQWLFKLVRKKKTIFWSGIYSDTFRITFYFSDKVIPLLESSDLPVELKDKFRDAKKYGLIRPMSMKIFDDTDVENVQKLVDIKIKLK